MNYRKANIDDIDKLIELRKQQLVDEGIEPSGDIDKELNVFFHTKLSDSTLIQLLVEDKEEIIACGAIIFYEFPPSYTNKSGKKAYITNMFTKENYRGQGIATNLLTNLVDVAKESGISKIWLGASKLGRPVYKKFGFKETDEWLELNF
ncbi:GNAT family N-acetyltransferase [Oceanobacillus chungangensis]|uniref:GNAT family N-acetyltransferase n=1 Tax=Oceanobacillus chungangensis TaxID=1229152 RepID=A0A3D8Q0H7_9BACI|nr:GNAT family N-acetyltransferase [Oceanobacillus chungangensis]RDW20919.1 GNAT family N-acetyltransferase [Oceanobacillus chungangensis]